MNIGNLSWEAGGGTQWVPLNREQALAARDFSKAGETFLDYSGQVNEILFSVLTPLGYHAYVSAQKLRHIEKHAIATRHKNDISHILNNPDLITPNFEDPQRHVFYKVLHGKVLLAIAVHIRDEIRYMATMYETPSGFPWNRW